MLTPARASRQLALGGSKSSTKLPASAAGVLGWGLAASVFYLITAAAWLHGGIAPKGLLYDGTAPLPRYQWVQPPPGLAAGNQPARPGTALLPLLPSGSPPTSVATEDGQCIVVFTGSAVAPRAGESSVRVRIIPLDPATVAEVPLGLRFDSNAYQIEAAYESSGAPVTLERPVSVILRSATSATQMAWRSRSEWTSLQTISYPQMSVVVADTSHLGTFVILTPATEAHRPSRSWEPYALGLAALIAVALSLLFRRSRGRQRP